MSTDSSPASQAIEKGSRFSALFSQLYGDIYDTLQPEKREIRLMTLVSGEIDEDIKVTLSTVSLDAKPRYEALSYVWGDPNTTRAISLNGRPFRITRNLEEALRRLRYPHTHRIFWVDAICINQQNISERNSQVAFMANIYGGCQLCTVWLGEEDPSTAQAMNLINSMTSDQHFEHWSCFPEEFLTSLKTHRNSARDLESFFHLNSGIFKPLQTLFEKPWWSRIWTVQELILPKLAVVKCGRHEISWRAIFQSWGYLDVHLGGCCEDIHENFTLEDKCALDQFDDSVRSLVISWESQSKGQSSDMIEVIAGYRRRNTSEPRDKIYGLLSLCSSVVRQNLRVDYSCDLMECYGWPMIHDIQNSCTLRALGFAVQDKIILHLPSWVADWSAWSYEAEAQLDRFDDYDLFNAAKGTEIYFSRSSRTLSLRGMLKDTISVTGNSAGLADGTTNWSTVKSWESLLQTAENQTPKSDGNSDVIKPFLRTIMCDTFSSFQQNKKGPTSLESPTRAQSQDYEVCKQWWSLAIKYDTFQPHLEMEPGPEATSMNNFSRHLDVTLAYQRFFVTESGAIGLGPTSTREGDEIWIVCGGKMPLILRPSEEKSASWELPSLRPCHTFVGNCYLDGIMNGEAADDLDKSVLVHIV